MNKKQLLTTATIAGLATTAGLTATNTAHAETTPQSVTQGQNNVKQAQANVSSASSASQR